MKRWRVELIELVEADSAEQAITLVTSYTSYRGAVAVPLEDEAGIDRVRRRNRLVRALRRDPGTWGNGGRVVRKKR